MSFSVSEREACGADSHLSTKSLKRKPDHIPVSDLLDFEADLMIHILVSSLNLRGQNLRRRFTMLQNLI